MQIQINDFNRNQDKEEKLALGREIIAVNEALWLDEKDLLEKWTEEPGCALLQCLKYSDTLYNQVRLFPGDLDAITHAWVFSIKSLSNDWQRDVPRLIEAFKIHWRKNRFFPTPAEIINILALNPNDAIFRENREFEKRMRNLNALSPQCTGEAAAVDQAPPKEPRVPGYMRMAEWLERSGRMDDAQAARDNGAGR